MNLKNCWDHWNCAEEIKIGCPAYQNKMGRECWMISSHYCIPKAKKDFKFCIDCAFFKELNS